ncbi:MAG: hypothetical protein QNJ46_14105 [Leptolyngbyaceae cyanobacterium MO_188.B28]|nr:hypothetical protein [Leptolyngbyaceae cyanobacterium MO_188.B28]
MADEELKAELIAVTEAVDSEELGDLGSERAIQRRPDALNEVLEVLK